MKVTAPKFEVYTLTNVLIQVLAQWIIDANSELVVSHIPIYYF